MKHYKMCIDGEWIDSDLKKGVFDKYSGNQVATFAHSTTEDVERAVAVAKKSFETVKLTPYQRYEILMRASELLLEEEEEMARAISQEAGRLLSDSRGEVKRTAITLELTAEEAKRINGEMVPVDSMPGSETRMCFTIRTPVGVVCAIAPFNVPLSLTAHKIAPAIAAGNTVVLKPAEKTPGFAVKLVEIFLKAGLPKGHLNLVLGSGSTVGETLLHNQDINFYTFTGSMPVGLRIKNTIGLRRCSMELGSNAAVIIHKDANVKNSAVLCASRGYNTAGQICMKPQRLFVHKDIYSEFENEIKAYADSLIVGDPADPKTNVGPMISEAEVNRVDEWVKEAVAQGAKIISGGKKACAKCYVPTVLANVKKDMKVVCNEIFGPVVVLIPYENIDEAIADTNDSIYGLQAGIFTNDINIAMKAAKEIAAGGIAINDTSFCRVDNMPYGGIKMSSAGGKEGPKYVIESMTDVKTIILAV